MRERALKFIGMVLIVIAVGISLTLLNLRLQGHTSESPAGAGNSSENTTLALKNAQPTARSNTFAMEGASGGGGTEGIDEAAQQEPQVPAGYAGSDDLQPGAEPMEAMGRSVDLRGEEDTREDKTERMEQETIVTFVEAGAEVEKDTEKSSELQVSYELLIVDADDGLAVLAEDYYSRLSDMDLKLTRREAEAAKKTAADQKAAADEALKFWDDELNLVYQAIRDSMTDEEFDALRTEEKAWLRSRDAAASEAAASANQSNSAQSLAYTRSLVESTRLRVYELAKLYYGE